MLGFVCYSDDGSTYNHVDMQERHRNARAGKRKERKHDVYAQSVLMNEQFSMGVTEELSVMETWLQV